MFGGRRIHISIWCTISTRQRDRLPCALKLWIGMRDYNVSRIMCLREQGGRKSLEVVLCDK